MLAEFSNVYMYGDFIIIFGISITMFPTIFRVSIIMFLTIKLTLLPILTISMAASKSFDELIKLCESLHDNHAGTIINNYAWNITIIVFLQQRAIAICFVMAAILYCMEFYVTERQTSCFYDVENKWHCEDGLCIEISERCDGNIDCTNGFDEMDCSKLDITRINNNVKQYSTSCIWYSEKLSRVKTFADR